MEEIIEKIPSEIIIEIKRRQKVSYSKKFHQIKQRNLKKIRYLENISKNKLVVQKKMVQKPDSNRDSTKGEEILSLGLKFNLPVITRDIPMFKHIVDYCRTCSCRKVGKNIHRLTLH